MLDTSLLTAPPRHSSGASLAGTQFGCPSLTGEERRQLDAAVSSRRAVRANLDLIREDAPTDQIFVLTEGWGCRYKTTRNGNRQIVGLAVPGDVANLDATMFRQPGYGMRVLTAGSVIAVPRDRLLELAERHPGIGRMLMRLAIVENGILNEWALALGRLSAQQRLAHLLCELSARVARDGKGCESFAMPLTQEQLADALGLTPVHVNRMMQQLRAERLVATTGRTVSLSDFPALARLAEFDPTYLHLDASVALPN